MKFTERIRLLVVAVLALLVLVACTAAVPPAPHVAPTSSASTANALTSCPKIMYKGPLTQPSYVELKCNNGMPIDSLPPFSTPRGPVMGYDLTINDIAVSDEQISYDITLNGSRVIVSRRGSQPENATSITPW